MWASLRRAPPLFGAVLLTAVCLADDSARFIGTVEDFLRVNRHVSIDGRGSGCSGTAPDAAQTKWFVLLCEHTASGTTHRILHDGLRNPLCAHRHTYANRNATFGIMFLANPFHRVLSSASYQGVVAGRHRAASTGNHSQQGNEFGAPDEEKQVEQFRTFVQNFAWLKIAPQSVVEQFIERRNVAVQFYGYTTSYAEDMTALLRHLQYDKEYDIEDVVSNTQAHCLSSCQDSPKHGERSSAATTAKVKRQKQYDVPWFDADTAAIVVGAFKGDFEKYGWSQRPEDMYKPPLTRIKSPCFGG